MGDEMTSAEVCRYAGITFRQLDYWHRQGWIKCSWVWKRAGSGDQRRWSEPEARRIRLAAQLIALGVQASKVWPDPVASARRLRSALELVA